MKRIKLGILILLTFTLLVGCSFFDKNKGNPYSKAVIYNDRVESEWAGIRYNIPNGHVCTEEDLLTLEIEMDSMQLDEGSETNTDMVYEMLSIGPSDNLVFIASNKVHLEKGEYIDLKGAEGTALNYLKTYSNVDWIVSETEFCGNSYYMYKPNDENKQSEDYKLVFLMQVLGDDRIILIGFNYSEEKEFDKMWNAFEPL